jgi:hypothetical protein
VGERKEITNEKLIEIKVIVTGNFYYTEMFQLQITRSNEQKFEAF